MAATAPWHATGAANESDTLVVPAREITPIPYGDAPPGTMQDPRYAQFARLQTAKNVTELLGP